MYDKNLVISGVACSRGTVLLRCLKSTLSFRSVVIALLPVGNNKQKSSWIYMLKEAEEQRLEALVVAGHNIVSHNMCAKIMRVDFKCA